MAKFCTKCGKKLKEGEVCDCQKETEKEEKTESTKVSTNEYVDNYINVVKGIFKKPVETMKQYGKRENFGLGLIMIAINCLITVLFVYLGFKELVSNTESLGGFFGYGLLGYHSSNVEIPIEVLVKIFVIMAGGFLSTAGMLYVIAGPLFKAKVDFKQLVSLVGVCSVLTTITTIVATICMYISMKLMFVVVLVSGVLYLTHLYHGFMSTNDVEEEKIGYTYTIAISVATFIVVYLLPKILF